MRTISNAVAGAVGEEEREAEDRVRERACIRMPSPEPLAKTLSAKTMKMGLRFSKSTVAFERVPALHPRACLHPDAI